MATAYPNDPYVMYCEQIGASNVNCTTPVGFMRFHHQFFFFLFQINSKRRMWLMMQVKLALILMVIFFTRLEAWSAFSNVCLREASVRQVAQTLDINFPLIRTTVSVVPLENMLLLVELLI